MIRRDLTETDRTQVAELLAAATEIDGVAALSEEHLLALREPSAATWVAESDGRVAGIASRVGGSVELVVHPEFRRLGLGSALARAALASDTNDDDAESPRVWAHGDLPGAREFAAALGLVPVRELLRLERHLPHPDFADRGVKHSANAALVTLADLPPADQPAALDAWLRLNAIAFADHPEQGRWTAADVAARTAEPWFDPELLLLAGEMPDLIASLWLKPQPPDPDGSPRAEVYVLAVHPDHAGQGLGRRLLDRGLAELARRGVAVVDLYVDGENRAARRLYERAGFATVERHIQYGRGQTP